ncbi:phosphatase PAP2 family protein [Shimia sp. W99]
MSNNTKALRDGIVLTAILAMIFTVWPALDLWVSGLFYSEGHGFWLGKVDVIQNLRKAIWSLILLTLFFSLAALIFSKIVRTTTPRLDKVWEVIVLTYLLGPALLVNAILKEHWGRARPSTITEFGGTRDFTPALIPSDQCATNCSFVSGEGAGSTALLIAILLIVRNMAPGRYTRHVTIAAFIIAGMGLSFRVLMGRHFLSDTILAALFVTLIALTILQLKRYRNIRLF